MDLGRMNSLVKEHGFEDFKWISGADIVVSQWVRMKCTYGCRHYGHTATCPPSIPPIAECREFFNEYEHIALIHFVKRAADRDERIKWSREINERLLKLETDVFLAGNRKAFLLPMDSCHICDECPGLRIDCNHLQAARPTPEALGIDVFGTVRKMGYPIGVLTDYEEEMNRYSFLLIE